MLDVVNGRREKVGSVELSDDVFGEVGSSHVVWEVVRHHLAARRSDTHATRTRGEVRGGGRKPWRQKGTGRARAGSIRSPLWRAGGTVHGPQPRSHEHPLPKRKKRVAARRVLASMIEKQRVTVLDELRLEEPRTRLLVGLLRDLGLGARAKALLLVPEADESLRRASGNLGTVKVVAPEGVNAYDLLRHRHLVATRDALDRLQEVLAR